MPGVLPRHKGGSELGETVADQKLHQHLSTPLPVEIMDIARTPSVVGGYRLDDGFMIAIRIDRFRPQKQGEHAHSVRLVEERLHKLDDSGVTGRLHQQRVEALVCQGPAPPIVVFERSVHFHDRLAQPADAISLILPLRREGGSCGFEPSEHLVNLSYVGHRDRLDAHTVSRPNLDQSILGQPEHRLACGRPAHLEHRREIFLGEYLTGRHSAV